MEVIVKDNTYKKSVVFTINISDKNLSFDIVNSQYVSMFKSESKRITEIIGDIKEYISIHKYNEKDILCIIKLHDSNLFKFNPVIE